jgi:RNA polymerase sigma-70 factor, ECF subfamily
MGPVMDDARRFDDLFRAHRRAVLGYALRRAGDPADAADVVAETFLVVWRRLDSVPPDALPWMLAVARRVLANQRRGRRRRDGLARRLGAELAAAPLVREDDVPGAVAAALAALSAEDRELLALSAWEGLTPAQIAVALDLKPVTARSRLHRARVRLREQLDAHGHTTDLATERAR